MGTLDSVMLTIASVVFTAGGFYAMTRHRIGQLERMVGDLHKMTAEQSQQTVEMALRIGYLEASTRAIRDYLKNPLGIPVVPNGDSKD